MRRLAVAALAVLPTLSVPCLAQEAPTQTLHIALREDADMLDPALARTYVGRIVFAGLCDKLFDIDDKLDVIPQLATGYEWTDSKTLVLHLRPNVLFQDGTPMDAAAVKYNFERNLNMQGSGRRGEIIAMDHAEVVDPTTVRIILKTPSAPFLAQLTDRAGMMVLAQGGGGGRQGFRAASGLRGAVQLHRTGWRRTASCWTVSRNIGTRPPSILPAWCTSPSSAARRGWPICRPGRSTWPRISRRATWTRCGTTRS